MEGTQQGSDVTPIDEGMSDMSGMEGANVSPHDSSSLGLENQSPQDNPMQFDATPSEGVGQDQPPQQEALNPEKVAIEEGSLRQRIESASTSEEALSAFLERSLSLSLEGRIYAQHLMAEKFIKLGDMERATKFVELSEQGNYLLERRKIVDDEVWAAQKMDNASQRNQDAAEMMDKSSKYAIDAAETNGQASRSMIDSADTMSNAARNIAQSADQMSDASRRFGS